MGDNLAQAVWLLLAMTLIISALLNRRLPMGQVVRLALVWIVLLGGAYLLFSALEPQINAWQQAHRAGSVVGEKAKIVLTTASPPSVPQATASGSVVRIPLGEDGHYWVDATVNGREVRFLIDSGASVTAMSQEAANALGLPPDPYGTSVVMTTANGTVNAERSTIASMEIGAIRAFDLPVVVSPSFGKVNVLGMNFLNKLKGWRVEGGTMILEPQ